MPDSNDRPPPRPPRRIVEVPGPDRRVPVDPDRRAASEAEFVVRQTGEAMMARFEQAREADRIEIERMRRTMEDLLAGQRDNRARGEERSMIRLEEEAKRAKAIIEANRARAAAEAAFERRVMFWIKAGILVAPFLGAAVAWAWSQWQVAQQPLHEPPAETPHHETRPR